MNGFKLWRSILTRPVCLEWIGDIDDGDFCGLPPSGMKLVGPRPGLEFYIYVCSKHGPAKLTLVS